MRRGAGALLLSLVGSACTVTGAPGPAPAAMRGAAAPQQPTPQVPGPQEPAPRTVAAPQQPPAPAPGLGPEILLPDPAAPDAEVARVGDLVLRQSHAYARLLTLQPRLALDAVDLLVFDVLVARHARQFGIRIAPERVEELAAAEERQLRQQVAAELGGQHDFAGYVWRQFGMREADWQATLRLRTAQRLYQGYVLRYLGLREHRVQVRFLVHKDEKLAREVADKVRAGADFATLAMRHSEDPSRRDGGLLPPFGEGFEHPVGKPAFALRKGEVSEPFQARWGDQQCWFVVYCLDRLEGRDVPFAEVAAEIDAGLARNPVSRFEVQAYVLRWRTDAGQRPPPAGANR